MGVFSINYDRFLSKRWTGRIGLGAGWYFGRDELIYKGTGREIFSESYMVSIPANLSYLIGDRHKFFELALGFAPVFVSEQWGDFKRHNRILFVPSIFAGYRRQPIDKGFVFRVGITPFYYNRLVHPGLGLSFGFIPK